MLKTTTLCNYTNRALGETGFDSHCRDGHASPTEIANLLRKLKCSFIIHIHMYDDASFSTKITTTVGEMRLEIADLSAPVPGSADKLDPVRNM